ncbi:MAG: PTS glucitol/sorbitol transporter subunit IIA [Eubacteriaceae bacterium]|jgi:PTS system glucitol/sorbitol-specific IIA component
MDYKSTVKGIGPLVPDLAREGNIVIVFDENAPAELAEMAILHTHCNLDQDVSVGDVILLGNGEFVVTAVGDEANHTLRKMGHCTFKFTGQDKVDLPGQMELAGDLPEVKAGDPFQILFT